MEDPPADVADVSTFLISSKLSFLVAGSLVWGYPSPFLPNSDSKGSTSTAGAFGCVYAPVKAEIALVAAGC